MKEKSDKEIRSQFIEAMEEGFRKEAQRKILEGGRFFTVRSKRTNLLCFASLIIEENEIRNYQVIRYKDKRIKWVSYEELLSEFELVDADPKPCLPDWISLNCKEKAVSDENLRKLLNQNPESGFVKTNEKVKEKSA
ncbi:hypothetical protein CH375_18650 [Leptospira ellisii]|nr:hypothetical protein CH375_18650 [Leptospira ellisii]